MISNLKKSLLIAAVLALAAALAWNLSVVGGNTPAFAEGCAMPGMAQHGGETCPMSRDGGMKGTSSCAMLEGKIQSVSRDGALTVRIKPAANTPAAATKAIGQLRVGDSISLMMMLGKEHATTAGAAQKAAIYSCPMHPEVTSDKPGSCSKCGMSLQPAAQKP
jgi:hypothetical protein